MLSTLVAATLQGLVVLAMAWAICRAFRRLAPSYRQILWWAVCLKFPLGLLWIAPIAVPVLPSVSSAFATTTAVAEGTATVATRALANESTPLWPWALLALWAIGAACYVIRFGIDAARLHRIVRDGRRVLSGPLAETLRQVSARSGLRRPPALVESAGVSSPMVVGLARPTVVVPEEFAATFEASDLEMALAHEVAHVRRGDLWTGLVPAVARTLFWFLPPVHWAAREWETEREAACDAEAIKLTQAAPPSYGRLLLNIVGRDERPVAASALGATAGFHTLKRRLASVGQPDRPVPVLALALPVLLFLPWQFVAPPPADGLLLNAGAEDGTGDAPASWSRGPRIHTVRYVWDRNVARSGRGSLAIFKTADRYFPIAEWTQSIPNDGKHKAIEVSAWVRAEAMYKAVLDVQFMREDGVASHEWVAYVGARELGDPPANHNWKHLGGVVEIPPGTKEIVIAPQVYGPGKVWFDDIEARFTDRVPAKGGSR